jgi:GMP synthase (glutamine-hydrolysing)
MKSLRIHYLQHVPFEDMGCIQEWAIANGHSLTSTKFFENASLPDPSVFDWLIVMGGPMGVYDNEIHSWIDPEKEFIKNAIANNKTVIGICLGSQLIASALGARVYPNAWKEIGWFPVSLSRQLPFKNPLLADSEDQIVFHWHGDTFDLPPGAVRLASNEACRNQAFIYGDRVIGLQFHFEVTEKSLQKMVVAGSNELTNQKYVQTAEAILTNLSAIPENNRRMFSLLDHLTGLKPAIFYK